MRYSVDKVEQERARLFLMTRKKYIEACAWCEVQTPDVLGRVVRGDTNLIPGGLCKDSVTNLAGVFVFGYADGTLSVQMERINRALTEDLFDDILVGIRKVFAKMAAGVRYDGGF